MSYLERPSCRIYYDLHPAGEQWVTLINGHTRSSSDFRVMTKRLNAAGFSVLTFDNRASGRSETATAFTLQDMIDDVRAIWEQEGLRQSSVLGISMGGAIALTLALQHGEFINKLILVSTSAHHQWIAASRGSWGTSTESIKAKMTRYFAPEFALRNQVLIDAMAKQILNGIASNKFTTGAQLQSVVMNEFDVTKLLPKIKSPTLVLHGIEDGIISCEAAKEITANIPQAKSELIAGVGHLLLAECPERFYEIVIEFLSV